MTDDQESRDRLFEELRSLVRAMGDAHSQEHADRAERQAVQEFSGATHADWARTFVYDLHGASEQFLPTIVPTIGRLVPTRIDPILNPFHGTHHDFRTTIRVSQTEMYVNACAGTVTIDIDDLRNSRRDRIAELDSSDLSPDARPDTLQTALETFIVRALAP
jgi:hypothetical protein